MQPVFIYNSGVSKKELIQYLSGLGIPDDLQCYQRNPEDHAQTKLRQKLLDIMLIQAAGLGWQIPKDWNPWQGLHTLPPVLANLKKHEILKLIQNQAKLLLKIAPRSICKTVDSELTTRTIIVPMTVMRSRAGVYYWGIPTVYEWSAKRREQMFVYDAIGKKRQIKFIKSPAGRGRSKKKPECHPMTADLNINDLKENFLPSRYGYPVPFLPKRWFDDFKREDDWKMELEALFPNGVLTISEPIPVEVVATEEIPTLKDIDEAVTLNPEELSSKLPNGEPAPPPLPLTPNQDDPYEWQDLALERWSQQINSTELANGEEKQWVGGIVEACTGAGKTRLCFKAIHYVLDQHPDARISIIVPKKVLLDQWYEEIADEFEDRVEGISRHSGDYSNALAKQISIWVIHTASHELPLLDLQQPHMKQYPIHFLIVDELHRSTSRSFRQIYNWSGTDYESHNWLYPEYRLGVTATLPSGDSNKVKKFEMLIRHVGPVVSQYKYADALMKGNISPFKLTFLETTLTHGEQDAYEALSEKVIKQWQVAQGKRAKGQLYPENWDDMTAEEKEEFGDPLPIRLAKFLGGARARIDWSAANRLACAVDLIRAKAAEGKKIIVFHKNIDGATALYNLLFLGLSYGDRTSAPLNVGLYHSQNPSGVNEFFLDAFRRGPDDPGYHIQVLVSVQSLLEGLNVPDADVGVAVAADKSQIKAVQSLGRVLRIKPGSEELKEYYLVTVNTGNDNTGDGVVKSLFIGSLLNKDGEYIIPEPLTIPCWPGSGYGDEPSQLQVENLHEKAGLMSYAMLKNAVFDNIRNLSIEGDLLTRSQLVKALLSEETAEDENTDPIMVRPVPVWPQVLLDTLKLQQPPQPGQLPPEPPISPKKDTPW